MKKLTKGVLLNAAKQHKGCGLISVLILFIPIIILGLTMLTETESGLSFGLKLFGLYGIAIVSGFLIFMYNRNYKSIETMIKKDQYYVTLQTVTDKITGAEDNSYVLYFSDNSKKNVDRNLYNTVNYGHPFYIVHTANRTKRAVLIYDAYEYEPDDTIILR